ncbi:MAG: DUF167 domain-containing protein [Solirubrobacterales bacterium]
MPDLPVRRLAVRLQPKARANEVVGERDGVIVIRVTAAPIEGKANTALIKFVAKKLNVPKSAVTLVRGERGREKLIAIAGPKAAEARRLLLEGT